MGLKKFLSRKINRLKRKLKLINNSDYLSLSKRHRKEPVEIYAFIRAKNEIATIEAFLNSIEGIITKGVIGYNKADDETDDGTEEVILKLFARETKASRLLGILTGFTLQITNDTAILRLSL